MAIIMILVMIVAMMTIMWIDDHSYDNNNYDDDVGDFGDSGDDGREDVKQES